MSTVLVIVLRLIHVFAGVFWAGAGFAMVLFVEPTTGDIGPAGGQFMRQLNGPRKFSPAMGIAGILSAFSGIWLFGIRSGNFQSAAWMGSGEGIMLAIGGLAGIGAMFVGLTVHRRLGLEIAALGNKLAASQGPPDSALLAQMGELGERIRAAGRGSSIMLIIAMICMAIAEYVPF